MPVTIRIAGITMVEANLPQGPSKYTVVGMKDIIVGLEKGTIRDADMPGMKVIITGTISAIIQGENTIEQHPDTIPHTMATVALFTTTQMAITRWDLVFSLVTRGSDQYRCMPVAPIFPGSGRYDPP